MRVLEYRLTGVLIPIGYSGYDGYGDFGKWGLAHTFHRVTHGVKKVVTSTPFKVVAGATLAAVALPHIAAAAGISSAGGAATAAGATTAAAGAVNVAKQVLTSPVGQVATQYAVQHQLQKEQYKQQKKLVKEQELAQLEAQKKALEQQLRAQRLSFEQQLAYMRKLQQLQAQILRQRMQLAQMQQTQYTSQDSYTRAAVSPMAPAQKKNDFMKYAMLGGGALLILMLAMNRG